MKCRYIASAIALAVAPAHAEEPARPSIALLIGAGTHGHYHDGFVRFSNGDLEFLSVDPGASLNVALAGRYPLGARLDLHGALWFGRANARYIEGDDIRPEVSISTTTVDLGVSYRVVVGPTVHVGVGGGLFFASQAVGDMTWDRAVIEPRTSVIGLHGLATLDVPLADRLMFRAALRLGVGAPGLGDLEGELARAEGETRAEAETHSRTDALLAVGIAVTL